MGTAVAQWLRCCATNRKVAGSIPAGVSGFFIDIRSFRSHYSPGVDSASNRNEYQEYFLGGKGGRCVRLTTYHHPVPLSRNLRTFISWNPLGLSGPVMGLLYLLFFYTVYILCAISHFEKYRKCLRLKVKCNFLSSQNYSREVKIRNPSRPLLILTVSYGRELELGIGYYLPS